jgi:hypothetical protein
LIALREDENERSIAREGTMLAAAVGFLSVLRLFCGVMVDGHVHVAPHGGVIAHAGGAGHHLEMVVDEKGIDLWLLDQRLKTVSRERARVMTLTVTPSGGKAAPVSLGQQGDHLHGAVELPDPPRLSAVADVLIGKRKVRVTLSWGPLDERRRLDDTDPMAGLKL